tara:strand:+ start:36347 stop:36835 length:489 start_codon:yes stop_codon:yes gene_type:complete
MKEKSQYKSLSEWKKVKPYEYDKAYRSGWLDDICETFGWERRVNHPKNYWTKELCLIEAKKYKTKTEWQRGSSSSCIKSRDIFGVKFFDECAAHMIKVKPAGHWNIKENCVEEANKYSSRTEWEEKSNDSYRFAKRNYWLSVCKPILINYELIKKWNNEYNT